MKKGIITIITIIIVLWLTPGNSLAQEVCARVKIEILQELTFERQAFDARMKITNGATGISIENIRVDVSIRDPGGNNVQDRFFMKIDSMENITSVDGSGTIAPGGAAEIHWLIIPSPGAGGQVPEGHLYRVGATLNYNFGGRQEVTEVEPDTIVVKPMPILVLDYFLPHEVYGDDPFTDKTEPPIPYSLGLRVKNIGHGIARALRIDSGQPKIIENRFGLLIDFRILGTEVNGRPATDSLLAEFGDIRPEESGIARWTMVSSLLGRFIEFDVSFTHADELGGELTSLIQETNAHFLIHDVLVDLPGRDRLRDFLAEDGSGIKVYESDNVDTIVSDISASASLLGGPNGSDPDIEFTMPPSAGFIYARVLEPTEGNIRIGSVRRSDGKEILPENFWVNKIKIGKIWKTYLHIFDYNTTGSYKVSYLTDGLNDTTPPLTRIEIEEPKIDGDPVHISDDTEILFLAEDDLSGVKSIMMRIDGTDSDPYENAINPFKFSQRPAIGNGTHTIYYYSVDNAGNREETRSVDIFLDKEIPIIDQVNIHPTTITPDAPEEVSADRDAAITIDVQDDTDPIDIRVDVLDDTLSVVRDLAIDTITGRPVTVVWDGYDNEGMLLEPGQYTIRVKANDGLGQSVEDIRGEITIMSYLNETALSPYEGADQVNPAIYGDSVVWQDNRNGDWDIYLKQDNQVEEQITSDLSDQTNPVLSQDYIVWQDNRNEDWDIYYLTRETGEERGLRLPYNQTRPSLDGEWIVYQSDNNGNWDIYAYNITTGEMIQITDHERDQVNPYISGDIVVWEDYRLGPAEIYSYNLTGRREERITINEEYDQKMPRISGRYIVWTDYRNGNPDIYSYNLKTQVERRLTYGEGSQEEAYIQGNKFAYVDFYDTDNPDISWGNIIGGVSERIINDEYKQEHPVLYGNRLVWQDNRSNNWQIYISQVDRPDLTIEMSQGFNLLALPREIIEEFPTVYALLTDWNTREQKSVKIMQYDYETERYNSVEMRDGIIEGMDFDLTINNAIIVYNEGEGKVTTDIIYEPIGVGPVEGLNTIGISKLANRFSAYDLIRSINKEDIISVQRFDPKTGRFQTVSIDEITMDIYGANFIIRPGDGFFIFMRSAVPEWRP